MSHKFHDFSAENKMPSTVRGQGPNIAEISSHEFVRVWKDTVRLYRVLSVML